MDRSCIAVVEDDNEIRALVVGLLAREGFETAGCRTAAEFDRLIERRRIDLAILDVMLPGEDGLSLCGRLRARGDVPVLMVTGKVDDIDRIVGLEIGADDYLAKPFNPRELLARIKSVLRRHRAVPGNLQAEPARYLHFAGWTLDLAARILVAPTQVVVALSGAEFRLLRVFLSYPNRVLSRDQLMDLTVGREADPLDRSIDVQVSRLRQRLDDDAREPVIIKTVRGEGYVLAANVEQG